MIAVDEDALICDLAETYRIYDYRALTPNQVALFSIGLKNDSRIKMKLSGIKYPFETILLAMAVDRLSFLVWSKTKDAEKGINKPKSMTEQLMENDKESENLTFTTAEEYEKAMAKINERV